MAENGKVILKITIWSVLLHVILIALTVLEVFIYSSLINTGQDNAVYERHAQQAGPYIGIIIGFVLVFIVASRLTKANENKKALICIGLPAGYIFLDIIILLLSGADLQINAWVFGISYLTKLLAGYLVLNKKIIKA